MGMSYKNVMEDKEALQLRNMLKTIKDKQQIADILAQEAVEVALKGNNSVFLHYYGDVNSVFILKSCVSFGLMQLMIEDFYIVKEVLGYNNVLGLLKSEESYITIVK